MDLLPMPPPNGLSAVVVLSLRVHSSVIRQHQGEHALCGATSIAKTSVGIDRTSGEQVGARLNVCRICRGGHAVWKNGNARTCGLMLQSMRLSSYGSYGYILNKIARDLAEDCPFGWWSIPGIPKPTQNGLTDVTTSSPETPGSVSWLAGCFISDAPGIRVSACRIDTNGY
jgi:hypothetical protein